METFKNWLASVKVDVLLLFVPFLITVAKNGFAVLEGTLEAQESAQKVHDALPEFLKERAEVAEIHDWIVSGFEFIKKTADLFAKGKLAMASVESKPDEAVA